MAREDDKPKTPRDLRRKAREIADSLAIAFILAMVIRHYVLEVFKIPTKSMEPTLLGDPWSGDKILVNKFAYDFRDPRRWEIAVFKYPVDTSKNYIKRVVGLPGENVRIRYGDLYVNGAIARKPWRVQQALWRLCPHSGEADAWHASEPGAVPWTLADGEFSVNSTKATEPSDLAYARDITGYDEESTVLRGRALPHIPTSDIMVAFQLIPNEAAGSLSVGIDVVSPTSFDGTSRRILDRWDVEFPLGGPECVPEVRRAGRPFARGTPCRLRPGRPTLVQVCNVDRRLIVRVGGAEAVCEDYEASPQVSEWAAFTGEAKLTIASRQANVTLREPAVYVDVYYTDSPNAHGVRSLYQLGPGEFFVLGDNSVNSNDSRAWEKVRRSYLVGEAFVVLWPLGRTRIVR